MRATAALTRRESDEKLKRRRDSTGTTGSSSTNTTSTATPSTDAPSGSFTPPNLSVSQAQLSPSPPGNEQQAELQITPPLVGESVTIRRTPEMKSMSQDRFNLNSRELTACPILEGEEKLKLLNIQGNRIRRITHMRLPSLVFLDLYNNDVEKISGLEGVPYLRVLMLGRNQITKIEGLDSLQQLDVLDLHNNNIAKIEELSHLTELRVLNLAGNKLTVVNNIRGLRSLTEINLRRNAITAVHEVDSLVFLQRIFLSSNLIASMADVQSICKSKSVTDLCLEGNPFVNYKPYVVEELRTLKHLDLRRISEEDRRAACTAVKKEEVKYADKLRRQQAAVERTQALERIIATWEISNKEDSFVPVDPKASGKAVPLQGAGSVAYAQPGGLTEYHASTKSIVMQGEGAELPASLLNAAPVKQPATPPTLPVLEPAQTDEKEDEEEGGIVCVRLEYMNPEVICTRFVPKLRGSNSLRKISLKHNNLTSLSQIAAIGKLETVRELEISDTDEVLGGNKVVMGNELASVLFPGVSTVNGTAISTAEREQGAKRFESYNKLLKASPLELMRSRHNIQRPARVHPLAFFPPEKTRTDHSTKIALHYVSAVLTHAVAIDSKIQLLNKHWDNILNRLVLNAFSGPE